MVQMIIGKTINGGETGFPLSRKPSVCPKCLHQIDPIIFGLPSQILKQTSLQPCAVAICTDGPPRFQVVFRCPKCQEIFISEYSANGELKGDIEELSFITHSSQIVTSLSSKFIEIYQQAHKAKANGLTDLYGMGLGKALEFLVKDFAIRNHPDEKTEIINSLLGICIKRYIDDNNIKALAERAAWIRNDETHYKKEWTDMDAEDLNRLINLIVHFIESQFYIQNMQNRKNK
jgi:hypothetical protein